VLAAIRDVLRDPLYRWEARRFWTVRRCAWTALALALFAALGAGCLVWNVWFLNQLTDLGRQAELDLPDTALGVLALVFWMRLARRAVERVFLNPEGA
jgi:TRAP-type uncharacterized transport system fused permease subunit